MPCRWYGRTGRRCGGQPGHRWYGELPRDTAVGGARAAGELKLTRTEFARAVQLGIVRAGPPAPGGSARYTRAELERVRSARGFPEALRERVETVAGAEAAGAVLGISPGRFTRLARCGHVGPVGYRINRYRAVVWLYLSAELREFARREAGCCAAAHPGGPGSDGGQGGSAAA